jgi:hypothetical protein
MRIIKLLPVFLLLTACEPSPLYLRVTGAGANLIAEVYEKWWFGLRSSETPCVHDLTLTRNSDAQVLWRTVVDTDRQCSDLRTFVVGRAPHGFRDEVRLAAPLSAGDYTLAAFGIGEGKRQFTLPLPR